MGIGKKKILDDEALHFLPELPDFSRSRGFNEMFGYSISGSSSTGLKEFQSNPDSVLDQAAAGKVKVITRGDEEFVLMSKKKAMSLTNPAEDTLVANIFANLHFLEFSEERPQFTIEDGSDQCRIPNSI